MHNLKRTAGASGARDFRFQFSRVPPPGNFTAARLRYGKKNRRHLSHPVLILKLAHSAHARLSRLLRGKSSSSHAARRKSASGARVICIDSRRFWRGMLANFTGGGSRGRGSDTTMNPKMGKVVFGYLVWFIGTEWWGTEVVGFILVSISEVQIEKLLFPRSLAETLIMVKIMNDLLGMMLDCEVMKWGV